MAKVFRLDVTKQNCWLCDHFRRNNGSTADPNKGSCTACAPVGSGGVASPGTEPPGPTEQDLVGAAILNPSETYCGDFKQWTGPAREIIVVVE